MPNRDSEKLITDGYTTTLLGDELMVCENMKHIRVTSVPSYTEVGMIILCLRGTAKICIFDNIHILAKNELAVILPGQLVSITELSPDFLCNIVVLSRALFDDTLSGFSRFSPLFFVYTFISVTCMFTVVSGIFFLLSQPQLHCKIRM